MTFDYDNESVAESIRAKRLCYSLALVTFNPCLIMCSMNAPKSKPIELASIGDDKLASLKEYLSAYNEKPYVLEAGGKIYIAIPSLYPTTTTCLLLRIEQSANAVLRFIRKKDGFFELSGDIDIAPARMSKRLEADEARFFALCDEIEKVFFCLERFNLSFDDGVVIKGYCKQVRDISRFLAVPIKTFVVKDSEESLPLRSNFSLFTAFCLTMMMLARNEANDRSVGVELEFFNGDMRVNIFFESDNNVGFTTESLLWDLISADRAMFFEFKQKGDRLKACLRPILTDWSYYGIKQNRSEELFELE